MNYVPLDALLAQRDTATREGREVTATELLLVASVHQMTPGAVAFEEWTGHMEARPEPGYETDAAGRFIG